MRRNSTHLELITPGATTWLPWISDPGSNRVDGYPNFDGFTGQSRSIRESAWQDFLDSGEPLEIVPDPVAPEPTPEPLWTAFNTAILTDPYWQSWALPQDLRTAIISAAIGANTDAFQTAYDLGASIVPPSTDAINNWQTMADNFNIPITFNPF